MALAIVVAFVKKLQLGLLPKSHPDLNDESKDQSHQRRTEGGRQTTRDLKQALLDGIQGGILALENTRKSTDRKRQTLGRPDKSQNGHGPNKTLNEGVAVDQRIFIIFRLTP